MSEVEGEEPDPEWEDVDRLTEWAENGDVVAMYNLGVDLWDDRPEDAKRWWTRAAEQGDVDAMCALGWAAWRHGSGDESVRWYQRAAENGSTPAMAYLGKSLVYRDPKTARRWLQRAAEAGDAQAMISLAYVLDPYDLWPLLRGAKRREAQLWLEKAAGLGSAEAEYQLAYRILQRDPVGVSTDPSRLQEARWRLERAADKGNVRAMTTLGLLLFLHDPRAALLWWAQAAEHGHGESALNIGMLSGLSPSAARERIAQGLKLGVSRPSRVMIRVLYRGVGGRKGRAREKSAGGEVLDQTGPDLNPSLHAPVGKFPKLLWTMLGLFGWLVRLLSHSVLRQWWGRAKPLLRRRTRR